MYKWSGSVNNCKPNMVVSVIYSVTEADGSIAFGSAVAVARSSLFRIKTFFDINTQKKIDNVRYWAKYPPDTPPLEKIGKVAQRTLNRNKFVYRTASRTP